ncbi:MAG: dihydrofolate reductase [Candidatus Eremiobacteraeota bacterium]|nr:dihydrofolate reductase [Candidatus Eremiobacteraeota bacterium]
MKFRIYCAMSLDGFIADHNGSVGFLDAFNDQDYGYKEFLTSIRTVVMGRRSYEFARTLGSWEYTGKRSIILTSQTLGSLPPEVDTTPGPVETLAADLREHAAGDVWIMGGGAAMGAFLDAGAVDTMELYVVPVLLGRGVRLFTRSGPPVSMKLLETKKFANGVVRTLYEK